MKYGTESGGIPAVRAAACRHARDHPDRRGDQPDQHRFGQQLADDAPARRAERRADRDFAVAHRGARQQQVGDVGARDQQHQRHGAHHRQDHQLDVLGQHPGAQRPDRARSSPRSAPDRSRPGGPPRFQVGAGLGRRHPRREPRHDLRVALICRRATRPAARAAPTAAGSPGTGTRPASRRSRCGRGC